MARIGHELHVTTETLCIWLKQADIDDGLRHDGLEQLGRRCSNLSGGADVCLLQAPTSTTSQQLARAGREGRPQFDHNSSTKLVVRERRSCMGIRRGPVLMSGRSVPAPFPLPGRDSARLDRVAQQRNALGGRGHPRQWYQVTCHEDVLLD